MKYQNVYCSQCGQGFGPGNEGFSICRDHALKRVTPAFDFTFAWEIFASIGGGHDEVSCLIGVDFVIDALGEIEVDWTVVDFGHEPWPELEACLTIADIEEISAEAELRARAALKEESEYNRLERYAPESKWP